MLCHALQRRIITLFMQERPRDYVQLAMARIMPLGPDGVIHPNLHSLRECLSLDPEQYQGIKYAWERYKQSTANARARSKLAVHQAVSINQISGSAVSAMCSFGAAGVSQSFFLFH